jgi:shikimate dehydrogenase
MKTYGLLGFPLGHSFSRTFFAEKFKSEHVTDCVYENFSFGKVEDAVHYLRSLPSLKGFNITIPHKRNIMHYLDSSSPVCDEIQSCNTVKVSNGHWTGFNTDVVGFQKSLEPLLKNHHKSALVFGTGGASRAVVYVLKNLGIGYQMVSRKKSVGVLNYNVLTAEIIGSNPVLINTTPVGQYPEVDDCVPIPYDGITPDHLVYDLIYNPEETLFLKKARNRGAIIKNGKEMLILQAEESWRIWNSASD